MFVRPRNTGRRPMPPRVPLNEINRPLLRQFVRNRRSEPRYEAYVLEVREGPAVNGNTNAAASKSIPQPWVTVRDFVRGTQSIGLPVSMCDALLKHLLTCVVSEEVTHTDSSEESDLPCGSPAPATDPQASSPARASGDAKSPVEEPTSEEAPSPKKSPSRMRAKLFQLSRLKPIRIECEATGCILEVIARDPTAKRATSNSGTEETEQIVQVDPNRRWIISAPLETRPIANTNGEQSLDNQTNGNTKRRHPWETRGAVELHENLMPQLAAFLADVVTRYRSVNQLPEVRSLYSASGGRRFFFDLRDTRWGKRLHISQVTDLHRNVIGIPLEALVSFRARLDTIIQSLGLEDQHMLRSELFSTNVDGISPRGQRRGLVSPGDRSNEAADSADGGSGGRKSTPITNGVAGPSASQRVRDRRRMRVRSFTGGGVSGHDGRNGENNVDHPTEVSARRSAPSGSGAAAGSGGGVANGQNQWAGGPRGRRYPRRNRNMRPLNRNRRPPPGGEPEGEAESAPAASQAQAQAQTQTATQQTPQSQPQSQSQQQPSSSPPPPQQPQQQQSSAPAPPAAAVQPAPEPAIDTGHVAPVAEASA